MITVGFLGLSHLGLVTSLATAQKGFSIVAFDERDQQIRNLSSGELGIFEPGLSELYQSTKSQLRFTHQPNDLSACDVLYISQDVPTDSENQSSIAPVRNLFGLAIESAKESACIVVLSQVPPGFMREITTKYSEQIAAKKLMIAYQVETLIFGMAVERALKPERFIVGLPQPKLGLPSALNQVLSTFNCPILPMRFESAELAKISINICLISSLSAANVISELCERIGADWSEIEAALRLDKRIGKYSYIKPGLGIAGGNLERDLVTLGDKAREHGASSTLIDAWSNDLNYRRDWALRTFHRVATNLSSSLKIAVWGLSYKKDTASKKNSPSIQLIKQLGDFKISAYDPQAKLDSTDPTNIVMAADPIDAAKDADILFVMTPWDEFKQLPLAKLKRTMSDQATVVDPYRLLSEVELEQLGFKYYALGRPNDKELV